jgi:hypothetical protein
MVVTEDDVGSVVMVEDTSSVRLLPDCGTQVLPRLWPMRLLAAPTLEEVTAEGEDESVLELMVEIESIDRYMRTARSFAPWVSARPNHVDGRTVVRRYAPRAIRLGGSNHQPGAAAANGVVGRHPEGGGPPPAATVTATVPAQVNGQICPQRKELRK